jgi:small subunit ribosomal protein S1
MAEQETPNGTSAVAYNWLEEYEKGLADLYPGQILSGTIMEIRTNEVLIDIGAKSEGVVDGKELERLTDEEFADLQEGQEIRVFVVRPESNEGHPILSIARAKMEQDWEFAEQQKEADGVFEAKVTGANKGGLIVHIGQVRGFVPASQLSSLRRSTGEREDEYQARVSALIGRTLKFKVLELDRRRNRLILSERAADREWRRDQKERLLESLQEGAVIRGHVSSLADFGAFVDLGGADGLIHVSELSWGRVQHPNEVVKVGQEIEVYVLKVDREQRRIGLSLKRLQPEPWTQFTDTYNEGDEVDVVVTKLTNFGVFARVEGHDIEGLIHISELANTHVDEPAQIVEEGQTVRARILRLETDRKRLGLSLRTEEDEVDEVAPEFEWPDEE